MSSRLIAGAMSGTSADGVDVAITRIEGRGFDMSAQLVRHHHRAYDDKLRRAIFAIREGSSSTLRGFAETTRQITLTYAAAVNEALLAANLRAADLAAVAAHGQTLFHDPPLTIQIFDPSLLAAEVGCAVVSDFRRADLAAGGQGAPLVPFADYILFRHPTKSRVLLNIGGIANITWLQAGGGLDLVVAYDTGPGNCVLDHLCRQLDLSGPGYDVDGERAARGQRIPEILIEANQQPYFKKKFPKSTDTPSMIGIFEAARQSVVGERQLDDLLATAALWTAQTIAGEIKFFNPDQIIMSGGGARNKGIMMYLRILAGDRIVASDELGVPSEAKEALAFALLAAATLDGVPSNVPSATGAKRSVVLGSITPKPI